LLACLLVGESVDGVPEAVNSQVASLAGGDDVRRVQAYWVALAEVGHGEDDFSVGVVGGAVIELNAAAADFLVTVQPALAGALTATVGANVSNVG
jgi:hypothetical protein